VARAWATGAAGIRVRRVVRTGLIAALAWVVLASPAAAGASPGRPVVQPGSGFSVSASYLNGGGSWNCGQGHQTIDFISSIEGGSGPYRYNWTFGDGTPPSNAQDPIHTYDAPGTYTVNVTVIDEAGVAATSNVTPSWVIPLDCSSTPTPLGAMSILLYAGLVAIVLLAGVVVLRWRRRPPPPE
jgi:hypothetical protein